MNLHGIVRGVITSVNPDKSAQLYTYKGETIGAGRKPVPSYNNAVTVTIQEQPLSKGDLQHADGLNIQSLVKSIHMYGNYYSVNRTMKKGGDLIVIDGLTWLVIEPMELWPDWCRLLICLQTDGVE